MVHVQTLLEAFLNMSMRFVFYSSHPAVCLIFNKMVLFCLNTTVIYQFLGSMFHETCGQETDVL